MALSARGFRAWLDQQADGDAGDEDGSRLVEAFLAARGRREAIVTWSWYAWQEPLRGGRLRECFRDAPTWLGRYLAACERRAATRRLTVADARAALAEALRPPRRGPAPAGKTRTKSETGTKS